MSQSPILETPSGAGHVRMVKGKTSAGGFDALPTELLRSVAAFVEEKQAVCTASRTTHRVMQSDRPIRRGDGQIYVYSYGGLSSFAEEGEDGGDGGGGLRTWRIPRNYTRESIPAADNSTLCRILRIRKTPRACMPEVLLDEDDYDVGYAAIVGRIAVLKWIPERLRDYKSIALAAVTRRGRALQAEIGRAHV